MNYPPTAHSPMWLLVDGALVRAEELAHEVPVLNRGLFYGDGLFESLRVQDSRILCYGLHQERMYMGMRSLNLTWPAEHQARLLPEALTELVRRTLPAGPGRIRLTVWRDGGGRYTPQTDQAHWLAWAEPWDSPAFPRRAPQRLIWAPQYRLPLMPGSGSKTLSASLYVQAAHWASVNGCDDALVADGQGQVAETSRANVFFLSGAKLYTPPVASGCVAGIVRQLVLRSAAKAGLPVVEEPITRWQLARFGAGFTTNISDGLRPIEAIVDGQAELRFNDHPAIGVLQDAVQSLALEG